MTNLWKKITFILDGYSDGDIYLTKNVYREQYDVPCKQYVIILWSWKIFIFLYILLLRIHPPVYMDGPSHCLPSLITITQSERDVRGR